MALSLIAGLAGIATLLIGTTPQTVYLPHILFVVSALSAFVYLSLVSRSSVDLQINQHSDGSIAIGLYKKGDVVIGNNHPSVIYTKKQSIPASVINYPLEFTSPFMVQYQYTTRAPYRFEGANPTPEIDIVFTTPDDKKITLALWLPSWGAIPSAFVEVNEPELMDYQNIFRCTKLKELADVFGGLKTS